MAWGLRKNHAKLFKNLYDLLTNRDFFKEYLTDSKSFTRKRSLSFPVVCLNILRLLKASLRTELKSFYDELNKQDTVVNWVSDAAFCKARQKITHTLFIYLSKFLSQWFYKFNGGKRWRHFRLLGVDGSALNLPSSDELLNGFGCHHTNSIGTKIPQARVSFLSDVFNKIILDGQIESFKIGEQQMLLSHLELIGKGDLLTADANYGHSWVIKKVLETKADFCFRINKSSTFVKEFLASGKKEDVLVWEPSKSTKESCKKNNVCDKPLKVRIVRIDLEKETEVLITSLTDCNLYSYESIKEIYNARWATEEEFKKFMQRLFIEFFSSLKVNGILQDFHANIFVQNMVSILSHDTNEHVFAQSKTLKYRKQINWTSALGDVRKRLVVLFLRSFEDSCKILMSLYESFACNVESIKPGRKFKRDKRKKGSRQKGFICYKPAF